MNVNEPKLWEVIIGSGIFFPSGKNLFSQCLSRYMTPYRVTRAELLNYLMLPSPHLQLPVMCRAYPVDVLSSGNLTLCNTVMVQVIRTPCLWRHGTQTAHPWRPGWSWSIVVCGNRGSGPRSSRLADLWETRLHLESWFCNKKKQTKLNNDPVWNYFKITSERKKRKSWVSGILNDLWETILTLQNCPVTIYTAKIININFLCRILPRTCWFLIFLSFLCVALNYQE